VQPSGATRKGKEAVVNITFACPHCNSEHEFEVDLPRPAPLCSNPNSPAFSDDGDAGGITDGPEKCCHCGADFLAPEIEEKVMAKAEKEAREI
jgi:hypothetical protein